MKDYLPEGHGVSPRLLKTRLIRNSENASPSITDAQFSALAAGVAKGVSILLVAPTSSGKTDAGLYGAASWLDSGDKMSRRVVYLASHRALARQKYLEFRSDEMMQLFEIEKSELVLATGDEVVDGTSEPNQDPMAATLVVATYEKFLALLSGSGLRQDMGHYCVIADEVQLLADANRGQDIEILLTLLRAAQLGQFIGLSAVLHSRDVARLSDWLGLTPIRQVTREVPLTLELRAPGVKLTSTFGELERVDRIDSNHSLDTIDILKELRHTAATSFPVAVFCMTKPRVEMLARAWADTFGAKTIGRVTRQLDLFEEASGLSGELLLYFDNEFGIHTADLMETERVLVEDRLDQDKLSVVFATTTLAQGMNYSFHTVLFDKWGRWNRPRQVEEPISKSEFHNMAGRAGRLGKSSAAMGRAIFCADRPRVRAAQVYLSSDTDEVLTGRIDPTRFDQLALQIVAAGIVSTEQDLLEFLGSTLSAHIARDASRNMDALWHGSLRSALDQLKEWGFLHP